MIYNYMVFSMPGWRVDTAPSMVAWIRRRWLLCALSLIATCGVMTIYLVATPSNPVGGPVGLAPAKKSVQERMSLPSAGSIYDKHASSEVREPPGPDRPSQVPMRQPLRKGESPLDSLEATVKPPRVEELPAFGKATYNKPETLQIGQTTEVSLVIQVDEKQQISDRVTFLTGLLTSAMIPVTRTMSAHLSGDNEVSVTLQSASEQLVSSRAPTQWRWQVKPVVAGKTVLTLEVFGHYKYDEKLQPVSVKVYRDEISTTATWFDQARQYITSFEPIRTTVFAVCGLFGTAILWLYRRYRREPEKSG
jgi:hypothetical protein